MQLQDRLKRTDSAARIRGSVGRLVDALGAKFDDLRPGVLLSRLRSVEADRVAFDNDASREELFPDVFAEIDDTLQGLRDLLAAFPIVRRIEAERLALDLDRNAAAVPMLREKMDEITVAAEQSRAATDQAIGALIQNDSAIAEATDPVLRTGLVGDKLLVMRNFLGAAAGTMAKLGNELGELGTTSWGELKTGLPQGIGLAARVGPFMALVAFTGWVAGPLGAIAAAVPAFKRIAGAFARLASTESKDQAREKRSAPRSAHKSNSRS